METAVILCVSALILLSWAAESTVTSLKVTIPKSSRGNLV